MAAGGREMTSFYWIITRLSFLPLFSHTEAARISNKSQTDKYVRADGVCVTVVSRRQRTRSEIECLVDCNNTLPHCGAITFYDGECQMSINTTTTRCVGQTVITYIKYEDSCVGLYKLINLEGAPSKCVYISPATEMLDWPSAKASCENDGAGLVTFPSAVQSQLFGDHLFSQFSTSDRWWVGGEKIGEVWFWSGIVRGEIDTQESHWHSGHSNSAESECMYYQTGGTNGASNGWNSHTNPPCTTAMKYICEKPVV